MPSYGLGRNQEAFDFEVPSGNTCRIKHADLEALIAAGVVDSLDELTSMVQMDHVDRVKKGKKTRHLQGNAPGANTVTAGMAPEARAALEIMKDPKRWAALQKVVNAVVVQCVLEPRVLPVPDSESSPVHGEYVRPQAGDDKMYVDEVSLMDRMAIFSESMAPLMAGQAAMKPFRDGSAAPVADVADGEDVQPSPVGDAGDQ